MIVLAFLAGSPARVPLMAAFTLAHLSDPHLPPLPTARLGDLAGKRALGYLNWTRNRHKFHRRDVLDALLADLQAQAPDQIAVTGDLVNLALAAEFEPARAWLESVGSPERVAIVPGNHDAYVRITRHRFSETFDDYLRGDAPDRGEPFPFLRRRGPLALIGVSSAVPTPPLMATGRLGRSQLDALDRILNDLSAGAGISCPADPSPAAIGFAGEAADRFEAVACAARTARRRSDPARARSCPFDHMGQWTERRDPGDRRAVGIRDRPWPLSRRRLQSVLDLARRRGVALRTDGAGDRRRLARPATPSDAAGIAAVAASPLLYYIVCPEHQECPT